MKNPIFTRKLIETVIELAENEKENLYEWIRDFLESHGIILGSIFLEPVHCIIIKSKKSYSDYIKIVTSTLIIHVIEGYSTIDIIIRDRKSFKTIEERTIEKGERYDKY